MRIDGHLAVADETAQRDAGGFGEIDGEGARSRDAGDHRNVRRGSLLHDLEAGPAADDEQCRGVAGNAAVEDQLAHRLVERVVAADVLERGNDFAFRVEQRGGVDAAGAGEVRLKPFQ